MSRYNARAVEPKWQRIWEDSRAFAATRDETVSQTARRMLLDGLSTPSSTEEAIDAAIASLLEARDRLGQA